MFAFIRRHNGELLLLAAALAWGLLKAWQLRWICDDAYIGYRYARHLAEGNGLVFNPGERVEGYTAFLWVAWCSLGFFFRLRPETWSTIWSLACYLGTIAMLGRLYFWWRRTIGAGFLPFAALALAFHPDMNIFATSGIETSAFTFTLVASTVVLLCGSLSSKRLIGAGALFAVSALTRADGVLPAVVAGLWVFWRGRPRSRAALMFGCAFAAVYVPYFAWRWHYYGDFYPNTYYAKSGNLTWYSQGFEYLRLYLKRYWTLSLAIPLAAWALFDLGREKRNWSMVLREDWVAAMVLLAALGLSYAFYIVRVGGDFMYARMLLPCTPFFLALMEAALLRAAPRRPVISRLVFLGLAVAPMLTPAPVTPAFFVHGIANERAYYTNKERRLVADRTSAAFVRAFHDLPIRVAIYGAEAKLAYDTRVPVAIDGLTDRTIAHQAIGPRTRPGHEKYGAPEYLVDQRAVHLMLGTFDRYASYIPMARVHLGPEIEATLLHWDPAIMAELEARGIPFDDFPAYLDQYIARVDSIPLATLREDLAKFRHFYFMWVDDPARERALTRRAAIP